MGCDCRAVEGASVLLEVMQSYFLSVLEDKVMSIASIFFLKYFPVWGPPQRRASFLLDQLSRVSHQVTVLLSSYTLKADKPSCNLGPSAYVVAHN